MGELINYQFLIHFEKRKTDVEYLEFETVSYTHLTLPTILRV